MKFDSLKVEGVRNLSIPSPLKFSPRINLICGPNGSGKTSIIESLYVLSLAKSFRSRSLQSVIQKDQDSMLLHALLTDNQRLGFMYTNEGERKIRFQGETIRSSADIAQMLPVQLLDHRMFEILEDGPAARRQLLDWGVFHVEPQFFPEWRAYSHALKQRNALLRKPPVNLKSLVLWERPLLQHAVNVQDMRARYVERLKPIFNETLGVFVPSLAKNIHLELASGWRKNESYQRVIEDQRDVDLKQGYTHSGPHRADIKITLQGAPAEQVLSRGQQKMLVSALKLAQAVLYKNTHGRPSIFLLDDLPAELDLEHRTALCRWLESLECQAFITSIDASAVQSLWHVDTEVAVFHVEHGQLTQGGSSP